MTDDEFYDLHPLASDPILGSRVGWRYCEDCCAIREPHHIHGDEAESLTWLELLKLVRVLRANDGK